MVVSQPVKCGEVLGVVGTCSIVCGWYSVWLVPGVFGTWCGWYLVWLVLAVLFVAGGALLKPVCQTATPYWAEWLPPGNADTL